MLADLGLAEHVVGRHGWDTVLDQSLPVCGDQTGLDYEALLRAAPTHVLTEWGARELPARLTDLAARHEWALHDFRLLSLDDIAGTAARLRDLFPAATPAESVERFDQLIAAPRPEPVWDGRVLLLMGTSPVAAIGPGSAHHELLLRAGGVPAITEGSPFMPLHNEDVLRLAPDGIILIQPRSAPGDTQPAAPVAARRPRHARDPRDRARPRDPHRSPAGAAAEHPVDRGRRLDGRGAPPMGRRMRHRRPHRRGAHHLPSAL
ncbi:MAG: hypothetical protein HND58_17905 [Planctomycetota bacterium]|nr:MAG: hypothetical protein HND58_17905 [Planctomycetota bacterium]